MAKIRRDVSVRADEQLQSDGREAILVTPQMTVVDIATGGSEPLWIWELED
jgi:hypothetical protein